MDDKKAVFISYAWDGVLDREEELRTDIVTSLSTEFPVFWDRRSISFGDVPEEVVSNALKRRPLVVFCLCDEEYIAAASTVDSGVYRELAMLAQISASKEVRVVPVLLDGECLPRLPVPLSGRVPLDISEVYARGLKLGRTMWAVASGASQEDVTRSLSEQLRRANVRDKATAYFCDSPISLYGCGRTHVVEDDLGRILRPPQWMMDRIEWKRRLLEEDDAFWPTKGIWQWHRGTASSGLCALGMAACAAFFPKEPDADYVKAIARAGILLAEGFFTFHNTNEPFTLEPEELVNTLISRDGIDTLERLLPSV